MFQQVTELFRRAIILPITSGALDDLADMHVKEADTPGGVRYISIPEDLFNGLWSEGVFTQLDAVCGTLLDDFEEDWLPVQDLSKAMAVVQRILRRTKDEDVKKFMAELLSLLVEAESLQHPVLFVL